MQPGLRVLYTSAEQFTNGFITSIREKSVDEFRRRHRDLSILCIDDAHFLANKSATQREFLHTFDTLGLENARLVLASDSHPNEVRALSKELRSRFVSGLVVRIDAPDSTLRRSLVERIAAARSIAITPDAVEAIASRPSESVREIEGMLTTLDAHLRVSGAMHVDAAAVRMYFSVKKRCTPHRPVRLNEITRVVSGTLCVEGAEVLGASRHKRSVLARSVAATLARRLTTASFPEIGRALGRRGHSGVIAAVKRIEAAAAVDAPCDAGPAIGVIGTEALLARLAEEIVSTQ
jgi:chromosomal replication initiator protein